MEVVAHGQRVPVSDLFPISQVPDKHPPSPITGEPYTMATVRQWVKYGRAGRRLKTVPIGRFPHTTDEWLMDFIFGGPQA